MAEKPSHVKQLSLNHVCKTGLESTVTIILLLGVSLMSFVSYDTKETVPFVVGNCNSSAAHHAEKLRKADAAILRQ